MNDEEELIRELITECDRRIKDYEGKISSGQKYLKLVKREKEWLLAVQERKTRERYRILDEGI